MPRLSSAGKAPPLGFLAPRLLFGYIAREFGRNFLLTLASFVSIYLLIDFFERIDRLLRAQMGLGTILEYFLAKLPVAASQVLPASIILGVIITFGLLSRHNETIAIRCAGLNLVRMLRPIILISLVLAVILLGMNLYLNPWLTQRANIIWETQVDKKPLRELIDLKWLWYKGDRAIFHIAEFRKDAQAMENVKIYIFDQQFHLTQFMAAQRAQWTGKHWQFFDGMVQTFLDDGQILGETFGRRTIIMTERPEDFVNLERKVTEMNGHDLYRHIQRLDRDGYDSRPYWVELQSRIAISLTPLIVTLIGGSLIFWQEKPNIPLAVVLGIGLVFIYWLMFSFFLSLGQIGRMPVLLAAWLANLIFILAAVIALRQ
ncbi:MAG: LPS export ABC transporter permease LptG, partial [Deltaproteobacteria bacterium]|nr:LPS export ABC transporter permease LptG [Deltaproteobacteria bacterium]